MLRGGLHALDAAVKQRASLAELELTVAASPGRRAAIHMYYLSNVAIFYRAPGVSSAYSDAVIIERARRAASSAAELLLMVEELLTDAGCDGFAAGDDTAELTPDEVTNATLLRQQRRTLRVARNGENGKALRSAKPSAVADGSDPDVQRKYLELTPQGGAKALGGELTPELLADAPNAAPFQPTRDTFNAVMQSVPRERAAGCLHDVFETLQMVWRHGGREPMYRVFCSFFAGAVDAEIVDLIGDLRAVCFYKDDEREKLRPIGIGEALRRLICKCLARQDRTLWSEFCTSMLPEDAESFEAAKAEAEACVTRARSAVTAATRAQDEGAAAAAATALRDASAELEAASTPPKFPINYVFSPNCTAMVVFTVQSWIEQQPDRHVLHSDKRNMYNESSRAALFSALDDRVEFQGYKPIFRCFYSKPARIFLVRADGELTLPVSAHTVDAADGDDGGDVMPAVAAGNCSAVAVGADDDIVHQVVRSVRGTHQGCVLGTFGSILPYHLSLHKTNKECPDMDIVCDADDTISSGTAGTLYRDFEVLRTNEETDCDLGENDVKLRALCPRGGTAGIPDAILEAQGGEVHHLKVVGAFVGPNTDAGIMARRDALTAAMEQRLAPLDYIDAIESTVARDAKQLRYQMLRYSASRMPVYWEQCMPPFITKPVMRDVVDVRLRRSLELITDTSAATPAQLERWWEEQQLPTNMGGADVGGNVGRCEPAYCGCMFACLPRLLQNCPSMRGCDVATHDIPMLSAFRGAYDGLCSTRAEIERTYQEEFVGRVYITLRNATYNDYYHPSQLPRKLSTIAALFDPKSDLSMPPQRMLNRVEYHRRWLACLAEARRADQATPHPEVRNREAVRFISVSQPTAAGVLDVAPDGTFSTTVENRTFSTYLQRRGGLNLSVATRPQSTRRRCVARRSGTSSATGLPTRPTTTSATTGCSTRPTT